MSQNFDAPQSGQDYARRKLNGPGLSLAICSGISIFFFALSMVVNIMRLVSGNVKQMPAGAPMGGEATLAFSVVIGLVLIAVNAVVLFGGLKMRKAESLGLCMVACVLAVIPCLSPCYFIGIPFGIWGLVALNDAQVKAAFN